MPNFDLATRLAGTVRPQPVAFPERDVNDLQDMSATRRQGTVEVLRDKSTTDETGGQIGAQTLAGQLSCWIQEMAAADENYVLLGGQTESRRGYYVGVAPDADVRTDDQLASPGWANTWRPATIVDEGSFVIPTDENKRFLFEAVVGGMTGNAEPDLPVVRGQTVADGGVVWQNVGEMLYLQIKGTDSAKSTPAEKVLICEVME